MSRLEELIQELCPDGVEFVPLGEVLKNNNAIVCVSKKDYKEIGRIPIIDQSQAYIAAYTDNESAIPPILPCIIFGDHTRVIKYAEHKFAQGDSGTKVFVPVFKNIVVKYIFYAFCNLDIPSRGYNRHWSIVKDIKIPLPPLPVQEEIVRILDKFTALEAELEAELEARKKQYSLLKSRLLVFGSNHVLKNILDELCPDGLEESKLGDVIKFVNGRAYKQEEMLLEGKYQILRVGNFYSNNSWYFSDLELTEEKYCYCGDLLYSWAATLGPQIWNGEKAIFHYHIWKLHFDEKHLCKKYLYYFLQEDVNSIQNSTTESTMPHVSMKNMSERIIPIPPMQIQARIVSILDRFDALVNDITQGLPAELAARRKQYEYYRDKLLTFKEKVS